MAWTAPNTIVFRKVVPPKKLVYEYSGEGHVNDTVYFLTTVTFEEVSGQTRVTMRAMLQTAEMRPFAVEKIAAVKEMH